VYDTQYRNKSTFKKLNRLSRIIIERLAGNNQGSYHTLKGHIAQGGDHLDRVHSDGSQDDQAGKAGPCRRRPRVSKLARRRLSCLSPHRSDGSGDCQAGGWSL
jgi:hypothetical protein